MAISGLSLLRRGFLKVLGAIGAGTAVSIKAVQENCERYVPRLDEMPSEEFRPEDLQRSINRKPLPDSDFVRNVARMTGWKVQGFQNRGDEWVEFGIELEHLCGHKIGVMDRVLASEYRNDMVKSLKVVSAKLDHLWRCLKTIFVECYPQEVTGHYVYPYYAKNQNRQKFKEAGVYTPIVTWHQRGDRCLIVTDRYTADRIMKKLGSSAAELDNEAGGLANRLFEYHAVVISAENNPNDPRLRDVLGEYGIECPYSSGWGWIGLDRYEIKRSFDRWASIFFAFMLMLMLCGAAQAESKTPLKTYDVVSARVVDGDTISVTMDLGFDVLFRSSARVVGVDAPEKSTLAGKRVRSVVQLWIDDAKGKIQVSNLGSDKYGGRFDAWVWNTTTGTKLNDYLISEKLARPFDGKSARKPWTEEELATIVARCDAILKANDDIDHIIPAGD